MRNVQYLLLSLLFSTSFLSFNSNAAPATEVLGSDYTFPIKIDQMPEKLSDFKGLEINSFTTNDNVKLSYWEAGSGEPIIFVPGWSANGAEYINVMYLLSQKYHVYVLDPRNQGLSQKVQFGNRISRMSMDLHELVNHLDIKKANFGGWSMGASVIWGYIDLFGTNSINKLVLVDEPISIYTHTDWSEEERLNAGGMTTSIERMLEAFSGATSPNTQIVNSNVMQRAMTQDSDYYKNSQDFANHFIKNDMNAMIQVMFDHASNDWRDVVSHKIDVPTAIFTRDYSYNVPSQKWANSVISDSKLFIFTKAEKGDHFLMFKNPIKFASDVDNFLSEKE